MKELNNFREFLAEGSSKLMSQGKYWVKNNDLGPKTTTSDIEKWVDSNFEKYGKPGDDKAKIVTDLAAYNDGLNKGEVINEASGDYVKELAMELVQYYDRPANMLEAILNVMSDGDAEKYLIMLMKENGIKIPIKYTV